MATYGNCKTCGLRRGRNELQAKLDEWEAWGDRLAEQIEPVKTEDAPDAVWDTEAARKFIADAVAERDRLRAALAPFAKQAEIIDSQRRDGEAWNDVAWFRFADSMTAITLGDCRAAAREMKEKS